MQLDFENPMPDAIRSALTDGLVGFICGIDGQDYQVERYDATSETFLVRRANEQGEVEPLSQAQTIHFPSIESLVIY